LYKELKELRGLGLIQNLPGKSLSAMLNEPPRKKSLHDFVVATEKGKEFMNLRKAIAARAAA
jgi:hypothetical protein